jgi:hypothetical protein
VFSEAVLQIFWAFWGHSRKVAFLLAVSLLALASRPAVSQAVYGSVDGTVVSASGEPIQGAIILALSIEKGTKTRAVSNEAGHYQIDHLLSDTYNIVAEGQGYKRCQVPEVDIFADQKKSIDLHLEKGSGETTLPLSEAGSILKTDRADVSTTLSQQELQDLPNFQRNFTGYEFLAPGALPGVQLSVLGPELNPQQGLQINQNGQPYSGSAFQLDGTDNRDPISGIIIINPNLESLSEIKLTSQNFDAEFGQALAGLVTAQTRSGTNHWHGSAFEIRSSDWAAASSPNFKNPNAGLDPFKSNLFGGSIGGPLVKNRVFVFGDYQGHRRAFYGSTTVAVPTETVRETCLDPGSTICDLSDYLAASPPGTTSNIYEPSLFQTTCPDAPGQGKPFPGNIIPKCMISQPAANLLALLPQSNTNHSQAGADKVPNSGYLASDIESRNDDEFDVRIDHATSEKLKLFGRYSLADYRMDARGAFDQNLAGGFGVSSDGFAGNSRSLNHAVSAGFDYIFTPSLNMDFRFGFYRYHLAVFQNGLGTTPATDAGIPYLNLGDIFSSGMPSITINDSPGTAGVIALGYGQSQICSGCPVLQNEKQFQFAANVVKIVGTHSLKWGADFRRAFNLRVSGERSGSLGFLATNTANPSPGGPGGGLGLATFLLGDVTSFNRFIGDTLDAQESQNRYFFYGQDTWRASAKLTLNYGLRWEIYTPQAVNGAGHGGFLDLQTGMINEAGVGPFNLRGNVTNSLANFAPRLGLAYHFLPRTVFRAAYGRSFDLGFAGAIFGDTVTQNPPVVEDQQLIAKGNQAVFNLVKGPGLSPVTSVVPSGSFSLGEGVVGNVVPSRVRVPTIDAWNFTLQHQLTSTMFAEVGYVANRGTHTFPDLPTTGTPRAAYDANQATLEGFLVPCGSAPSNSIFGSAICLSDTTSRQPFFSKFGWDQKIFDYANQSSNNYQSLQAKFEKQFQQGLQVRASYTWSKVLTYSQDYFAIDPGLEYGPANYDRANALVVSNLWNLPIGKGRALLGNANGIVSRLAGGWSLNTVSRWYSGLPFTPTYQNQECGQDKDTGPCTPNIVGPVHIFGSRNNYFTTTQNGLLRPGTATLNSDGTITVQPGETDGPWQRPAPGTFGNAGHNSLRGPGFFDTDLAILKSLPLTESSSVQFRMDIMNLFNHVNLGPPNSCVDCGLSQIGNLANGATMRQLEFALKLQF